MFKTSSPPPLAFRQNPMGSPAIGGPGSHGARLGLMVEAWEGQEGLKDNTHQVRLLSRPCSLANGLARPVNPSPEN